MYEKSTWIRCIMCHITLFIYLLIMSLYDVAHLGKRLSKSDFRSTVGLTGLEGCGCRLTATLEMGNCICCQ